MNKEPPRPPEGGARSMSIINSSCFIVNNLRSMEKKMFYKSEARIFEAAKRLRKEPTFAEEVLWNFLRQRPLGYKFRRQHPISNYVVDFFCVAANVAIEIDGSIHDLEEVIIRDKERQNNLNEKGIKVIRFRNEEVIVAPDLVTKAILEFLPPPVLRRGRGTQDEVKI
jgi:imidazole glycerol-phosphate synthase subunit HisF